MQAKPVQIAVIVIGLLVGIVGIFLAVSKGGAPDTASSVMLVDVTTGEMFKAKTKNRTLVLPMKHPESGLRTLMRVTYDEAQDAYFINTRYIPSLERVEGDMSRVNIETGQVTVDTETKPKSI